MSAPRQTLAELALDVLVNRLTAMAQSSGYWRLEAVRTIDRDGTGAYGADLELSVHGMATYPDGKPGLQYFTTDVEIFVRTKDRPVEQEPRFHGITPMDQENDR
jgi:hypothetical protein